MEKLSNKVTKLLQKEKIDKAIELISKYLAELDENIPPIDIIRAYHLFYECYSLRDFEEAHKSLISAANYLVEEANKKVQYNQDDAVEDYAGAVIRYTFGGALEKAEEIIGKMEALAKIDRYESFKLATSIFQALKMKKMDDLFKIKKKFKKFFNEKENNSVNKEIEHYTTPKLDVQYGIPGRILAGSLFRLDIIIKNDSPNIAKNIESKIIPPRGFRFRNSARQKIKIKRLEPNEKFNHYAEFFIDEKEYGKKTIEYQTVTYEDIRGKKFETEFPHTKLNIGTQSGVFAGTIINKAPKSTKAIGAIAVLDITEEDKKSIDKLKKKKNLFKEILRKNEENLNKKIITNDEYMTKYVLYREKLDEIDKYLDELGYKEKEGYTEVTCVYDGSKFYVEDGLCPRCGDLYTIFFDEIISVLFFMIIHSSGVCIFNKDFGKELDADLTSGLITAVQSFLGELTGQEENRFTEFSQSGFHILTCNGKYSTSAIVMSMQASDRIKDRLIQFVELFENKYENKLMNFSGNLDDFRGSTEVFESFFPIPLLLPHKIYYNMLQTTKISPISEEVVKIPELKERKFDIINLNKLIEIARKRLRRLDYGKLVASILELQEKHIIVPISPDVEEEICEQPDIVLPSIPEAGDDEGTIPEVPPVQEDLDTLDMPKVQEFPQIPEIPSESINSIESTEENAIQKANISFCIECGAELPPKTGNIQFCINCGARQPD
ncbi:MAG: zinc ribbon domain-containing protein [Candidatus Helarchaeota archaeon]